MEIDTELHIDMELQDREEKVKKEIVSYCNRSTH